jgi:sortase (surface protein transpeptidase)
VPDRTRTDRSLPALLAVLALLAAIAPSALAGSPRAILQAADRADRAAAALAAEVALASTVRGFDDDLHAARALASVVPAQARGPVAWVARPDVDQPESKAQSESPDAPRSTGGGASAASYRGRNHVWIPSLGIDRSVTGFACSSSAYPGNRVYRWGCAGRNNVYLFGHAHSVFKPLHDAYVRGRLKKGMKVYYADSSGKVSRYVVRWWRVTTPDKGEFAYAGQSVPSLTLQTCVGARSQYRLIVRLTKG